MIGRVPRDQLPPHMQTAWDGAMALQGNAVLTEVMGNAPHIDAFYRNDFYKNIFYSGRVELRIVELIRLRLANVHACAHCNRGDTMMPCAQVSPRTLSIAWTFTRPARSPMRKKPR